VDGHVQFVTNSVNMTTYRAWFSPRRGRDELLTAAEDNSMPPAKPFSPGRPRAALAGCSNDGPQVR
jgi:hypothetical protein